MFIAYYYDGAKFVLQCVIGTDDWAVPMYRWFLFTHSYCYKTNVKLHTMTR